VFSFVVTGETAAKAAEERKHSAHITTATTKAAVSPIVIDRNIIFWELDLLPLSCGFFEKVNPRVPLTGINSF
jgi:hypothetical protein